MATAKVPCPACKAVLAVPADKPGVRVRCPKCQHVFAPAVVPEEPLPVAEAIPEPIPEPVPPEPVPEPVPAPAAKAKDENDFYKWLAEATDPVAAVGQGKKPPPEPGESGNPLPLDDDPPPAKTAKPAKADTAEKTDKDGKA